MPFADLALGTLNALPLEIRWQIYTYASLDDPYSHHIPAPPSLFQTHYHDPYIPAGLSRASRSIWREVEALHAGTRTLHVLLTASGWSCNRPPWAFRADWQTPDYTAFASIHLRINPPPDYDLGQFLLLQKNITAFVAVLNTSPTPLPPLTIDLSAATSAHEWTFFLYPSGPSPLHACPAFDSTARSTAHAFLPFLALRNAPALTVTLPPTDCTTGALPSLAAALAALAAPVAPQWPVPYTAILLPAGVAKPCAFASYDAVAALLAIEGLVLDRELDRERGPTARRLREERAANWGAYVARLKNVRRRLGRTQAEWLRVNRVVLRQMVSREWRRDVEGGGSFGGDAGEVEVEVEETEEWEEWVGEMSVEELGGE